MPHPRRKKLIAVLLWTLAITALLNLAADALHLKYHRPRSPRAKINAYVLQQSGQQVDILFLGTSRTRDGVNANLVMDVLLEAGGERVSAFNVAQPASGIVASQILLRDLIRSNGCPRVIVLGVSHSSLNQNGVWWPALADLATARDVPLILPSVVTLERLNFLLASTMRGGARLYDRIAEPPKPRFVDRALATNGSRYGALTWRPEPGDLGPGERAVRMARNLYRRRFWHDLDIGGSTTLALSRCADLAKRCSAQLVVVRMPSLIGLSPEEERAVGLPLMTAIHELEASDDVVFFDAVTAETGIRPIHFLGPTHLNLGGSIAFSEHLAREVLLPALGRTR